MRNRIAQRTSDRSLSDESESSERRDDRRSRRETQAAAPIAEVGMPVMRASQPATTEPVPLGPKASERAGELIAEFQNRPEEVPDDIERQNLASLQRNKDADQAIGSAGDAGVPESVREVISSSGQSLDASIQHAVEDRMGDSFGDVRIHTGPTAAKACEDINARAFTVGNHIAFNAGEYDPESPQGQHLLAHELAHVRQQTGGTISMMPQANVDLEIDPDPQLEREAEETAQRVMEGGELGIQRMGKTEVHVQRSVRGTLSSITGSLFGGENDDDDGLSLESVGDKSGVEERLYALTENQEQLAAKVDELTQKVEGGLFQAIADAGAGEAIKMGATEIGKQANVPFGETIGSLTGAALQAIYNNRDRVLEILGLKSENMDKLEEKTGEGSSTGDAKSRRS
ncbi:hypothetical protein Halru_0427 [Halovivax ruber XH-70]|uniref:eCIS core domain-containing protein n=1 Tax=Halovivax ruber (strain DSM 18193 / JCM 13892 / XH-70) TaxID=797302 RepID=L0I8N4_HALRX|nr:DUF4157 domain-containing protein [Halovivax ruber]AGB15069.1 hypothetical protein Halru_0427 [Halovivax ruber XH-70]